MLIDNAKDAWKMTSVIAAVILGLLNAAYSQDFYGLKTLLSVDAWTAINAALVGIVIPVLRILKQASLHPEEQVNDEQK